MTCSIQARHTEHNRIHSAQGWSLYGPKITLYSEKRIELQKGDFKKKTLLYFLPPPTRKLEVPEWWSWGQMQQPPAAGSHSRSTWWCWTRQGRPTPPLPRMGGTALHLHSLWRHGSCWEQWRQTERQTEKDHKWTLLKQSAGEGLVK